MRYWWIYIPIVVISVSCTVRRGDLSVLKDDGTARWAYVEGLKAAAINGDDDMACRLYSIAVERDSMYAPAWYGLSKIEQIRDKRLLYHFAKKAVEIDSTNLTYRSNLGLKMLELGKADEAIRFYNQLLIDDPHNYLNYKALATLYNYKELPFSAISLLDSAEMKFGKLDDLVRYRLKLLNDVRLFERATADAAQILESSPNDIDALLIVIWQADREGREHDFLTAVRTLFEQTNYPFADKKALFERISSNMDFYRRNYFDIHTLATALYLAEPNNHDAVDVYANHLLMTGDINEALTVYKSFLSDANSELSDYQIIIEIESYFQRTDSVAKYAVAAIAKYPRNSMLYTSYGVALLSQNQNREALRNFKLAVKYAETDSLRSIMHGSLGDVYHQLGEDKKCYAEYRKALKLDYDNALVLNNYAYFMCEQANANLEECLKMSMRANKISPSNSSYLDTQAWILHLLNRNEEAKRVMMLALSLDSSRSKVLYEHYADILEALGDDFMAGIYRKRAKEE